MMDDKRLKGIEARLDAATNLKGAKWDGLTVDPEDGYIHVKECSYLGATAICLAQTYEDHGSDCMLLQHAPDDLRDLLAEVRRLQPIVEAALLYADAWEAYNLSSMASIANEHQCLLDACRKAREVEP
jgi:hypothetical protein